MRENIGKKLADALIEEGFDATYGHMGEVTIQIGGKYQIVTGFAGWNYGGLNVLEGGGWQPWGGSDSDLPDTGLPDECDDLDALIREWKRVAREFVEKFG